MSEDLRSLLKAARDALARNRPHADTSAIDAELLLAKALGKPRSFLYAWPDHVPTQHVADRFRRDIATRAAGQPVAYTLGVKEFFGLELAVTPAVLIPRPETELLVELALDWLDAARDATVVDLGTGSGAVALAVQQHRPAARVVGTDVSADALAVAVGNGRRLALPVAFARAFWCDGLADRSVDLLLSNPPYVTAGDRHLPALAAEPSLALVAGDDGLDALRAIASNAPRVLRPGGAVMVEHGVDQEEAVAELFAAAGLEDIRCELDIEGRPRVTLARLRA